MMGNRAFWVGILGGVVAAALLGFFAVPALGIIPMAATGKPGLLDWWGNANLHSSLQWRAPDRRLPESADPAEGLAHFQSSCLHCHGAPGISRAGWAHHMQPMPPKLWEKETQQMSDGDLFHIIGQGVRMTGMPAFGPEHHDEDIWNMVAFVRQLNDLSDEQEQQLQKAAGGSSEASADHHHPSDEGQQHDHTGESPGS